jgi:hypothetical protein
MLLTWMCTYLALLCLLGCFWNQFCAFDDDNQHILNMFFLFFSGYISCSIATSNGHHRFGWKETERRICY